MTSVPYISEELLRAVEDIFPNKLPTFHPTDHELGELMGQQQVVLFLKYQSEIQREHQLQGV